jgi:hypothetical protein
MKYFNGSFITLFFGCILAYWVGYEYSGTTEGALKATFLVLVLSILEVSISFDNAIVNAKVLNNMSAKWQRRFMTWGMLIAVFGMRVFFPLIIVSIAAQVSPWNALMMASFEPQKYADLMLTAHLPVTAFGGAFLFMLSLKYFFDTNKDVHWIRHIEAPLTKLGKMEAIEAALTLLLIYATSKYIPQENQIIFLTSGIMGIITYIFVDGIGAFLETPEDKHAVAKSGLSLFLYLEVLDASFSFDGVVGAFAISNNLFLIAIGLGIGAMFVRSLTIYFVEKKTLAEFRYIEHGAFYAIWTLAFIMIFDTLFHFSEWVTGLIGAILICLSFISSVRYKKSNRLHL